MHFVSMLLEMHYMWLLWRITFWWAVKVSLKYGEIIFCIWGVSAVHVSFSTWKVIHTCIYNQTEYSVLTGSTILPSYNHYRVAWYAFLELMDIDFNNGFCCELCGIHPSVIIMDATTLAFQKSLDFKATYRDIQKDEAGDK